MGESNIYNQYELQLLGRIIFDKEVFFQNSDVICEDLFHHHRDIFQVYFEIVSKGQHPGVHRILAMLPDKKFTIKGAIKNIDYDIPTGDLILQLKEASQIRHIDKYLFKASHATSAEDKILALSKAVTEYNGSDERVYFRTGYEIAKEYIKTLGEAKQKGIPTGYMAFDSLTGGLQPTDLIILAAQSSVGKTALSLNIAENVVNQGVGVCIVSLEMSDDQIIERMIVSKSGVPKHYAKDNIGLLMDVASQYKDRPLHIADVNDNRITHILGLIRGAVLRYNARVAIVDYLQLVQGTDRGQNREQEVGTITRLLKNIAKELNICVIALSQLNRPRAGVSPVPTMSRLRDSGQIEEAADVVWFVYRPEYHGIAQMEDGSSTEGVAIMIIAKGRNYGTTTFKTEFKAHITKFTDTISHERYADTTTSERNTQESLPF